MASQNHALIFGASGVSGWGTMVQALSYPTPTTFASITGLTNRPISKAEAMLPDDPRLQLVSGVDLSGPSEATVSALIMTVPHIFEITHAFFFAYAHADDNEALRAINTRLANNALVALKLLSPRLKHFVLQTGGKTYGIGYGGPYPVQPFKETAARSNDKNLQDNIFYYPQIDALRYHNKGTQWGWTETIPDGIMGFAPTSGPMNLARSLAIYFSLWRKLYGAGSDVPFTGGKRAWTRKTNLSPMDSIARLSIHAALNSEKSTGKSYNITEDAATWSTRWPALAGAFGLKGVAPTSDAPVAVEKFVHSNARAWAELEREYGLKGGALEDGGWEFFEGMLSMDLDRVYDNSARRELGFNEQVDATRSAIQAFREFAQFKQIPPLEL